MRPQAFAKVADRGEPGRRLAFARPMKLRKSDLEILATSCAIFLIFYFGSKSPWTPEHIAGAILLAIGFIGWLTARLQIREFFAVTAQAQGLVTTGIYARIRNPIYFFGVVLFAGMALYLTLPWWVLLVLLLVVFMQVWRARNEARVLEAKFGDAYREYRRKTWF